jgi:hypothetical protein
VLPVAHAGHWIVYVLYAIPVLIVLASILFTVVRDRRRGPGDEEPSPHA